MRKQAGYGETTCNRDAWRGMNGIYLAKVLAVDATTGLVALEMAEGSQPVDAMVMTPAASATTGWIWLPQPDDLVVCAFLHGNSSRPVILGSVYALNDTRHSVLPGDLTVRHQSGTSLVVAADGTVTLTQVGGSTFVLSETNATLTHAGSTVDVDQDGHIVATGPNGQKATLDGARVKLEAGTAKIQILQDSGILVTPGGSGVINLGGNTPVIRQGDATGSPIGPVADHYHLMIGGSSVVIAG